MMDVPKLWHCTPAHNTEAILEQGLHPTWEWVVHEAKWVHVPVHVSVGFPMEDFICELFELVNISVFEVEYADLVLHPGEDGLGTFGIYQWVPPEVLRFDHLYEREA